MSALEASHDERKQENRHTDDEEVDMEFSDGSSRSSGAGGESTSSSTQGVLESQDEIGGQSSEDDDGPVPALVKVPQPAISVMEESDRQVKVRVTAQISSNVEARDVNIAPSLPPHDGPPASIIQK
ncbi:hypothetical protein HDU93_008836 [Gonapodya sp. JEL0774]|nr:hypothetical protein HDU93_008836 [Gonapodya sp. JEL0774]